MGRPRPSEQVQEFAVAFACAVTTPSASVSDYVARSGEFSLFALLGRIAPKVCTPLHGQYFCKIPQTRLTETKRDMTGMCTCP